MDDILDISDVLFDSGLEKKADAVLKNGSANYYGKVIFRNNYQRASVMDINYQGSNPIAIVPYNMVSNWEEIITNSATILIDGENNGSAFTIREVKPNKPNYCVLELSID